MPSIAHRRGRKCEAVHPYVSDPTISWEGLEAATEELKTSCAGVFEDPRLNVELRRFLYRDAIPLVTYVAALGTFGGIRMGQISLGLVEVNVLATNDFAIVAACFVASVCDIYAFFRMSPLSPWTSVVRIAMMLLYLSPMTLRQSLNPAKHVLQCGDIDTIDAANATNSTTVATAAVESALADRQQYCIDVIDWWFISAVVVAIAIFRMMPVHAMPALLLFLVLAPVGYVVREQLAPAAEEGYEAKATSIAAQLLVMAVCWGIGFVRCVRSTEIERQRFVAAAEAERARRLAIQELRQVDALLKRALPEAVLERLAVGAHMVDESDDVTVIFAKVDVARRGSSSSTTATRAGGSPGQSQAAVEEAATVGFLHRVVSEFDEHLASGAGGGVSKVKTVGDVYWAVAGLPEAVACHASAACRFAVGMHATAAQVEDGSGRGELRAVLRVGVHSGSATGAMLGTQRLSYEPFGPACDGARVALRRCAAGTSLVTDGVKRRLGVEARQYAGDVDSEAMFATEGDVDAALEVQEEVGSGAYVLYELPGMARLPGSAAVAEALVRQLRDDAVSVRSRSVGGLTAGAAALAEGWVSEAMRSQRAQLEQRLGFLLARAASAREEERRSARLLLVDGDHDDEKAMKAETLADDDENGDANGGSAAGLRVVSRWRRVPLVYTFADAEEERGYLRFVHQATHVLRRDVRAGVALLFTACAAFYLATGDQLYAGVLLAMAAGLAWVNVGLVASERGPRWADAVVAHVAFAGFFATAAFVIDAHILSSSSGVQVWFAVYATFYPTLDWTLPPLLRIALILVAFAPANRRAVEDDIAAPQVLGAFIVSLTVTVAVAFAVVINERYTRQVFVEMRAMQGLIVQKRSAAAALRATVDSVMPRPFSRLLAPPPNPTPASFIPSFDSAGTTMPSASALDFSASLPMTTVTGTSESADAESRDSSLAERLCMVTAPMTCVGVVRFARHQAVGADGDEAARLLAGHRMLDGLLGRCRTVEKVKTAGRDVLLWERAVPLSEANGEAGVVNEMSEPTEADVQRGHHAAANDGDDGDDAALFVAEVRFLTRSLRSAGFSAVVGMDRGSVTAVVLGTERISLDLLGPTVTAAMECAEAADAQGQT